MTSIVKFNEVLDFIRILDFIPPLPEQPVVEQDIFGTPILTGRYYIALHNVLLPIAVRGPGDSIPRAILVPNTTIYIHDQNMYAVLKAKNGHEGSAVSLAQHLPVIDLSVSESLLLLASSALAYRISLAPNEKGVLRIMPNNIRTYVEIALKIIENITIDEVRTSLINERVSPHIMEFVLWTNDSKNSDLVEVKYRRGITVKTFTIVYRDYEIDLKSFHTFSPRFIARLISLLPNNILTSILSNIETACKIVFVFKRLSK